MTTETIEFIMDDFSQFTISDNFDDCFAESRFTLWGTDIWGNGEVVKGFATREEAELAMSTAIVKGNQHYADKRR